MPSSAARAFSHHQSAQSPTHGKCNAQAVRLHMDPNYEQTLYTTVALSTSYPGQTGLPQINRGRFRKTCVSISLSPPSFPISKISAYQLFVTIRKYPAASCYADMTTFFSGFWSWIMGTIGAWRKMCLYTKAARAAPMQGLQRHGWKGFQGRIKLLVLYLTMGFTIYFSLVF